MSKTPLAWKNLVHDPRRLAVAAGGVGFAVLLMFMELGFLNALLDSTVEVIHKLDADLIIVSKAKFALLARERFSQARILQARNCAGVRVYPVYLETAGAILRPEAHKGYSIRVLAYQAGDPVFRIPEVQRHAETLEQHGVALVDTKSGPDYRIPPPPEKLDQYQAELSGRQIQLVGRFPLCTDFANDGNLVMTAANFAAYFPQRAAGEDPLSLVDLGVVQRTDKTLRVSDLQRSLREHLESDVLVFTKAEFIRRERGFWQTNTPIGYIFTVGTVIGFLVGVILCYQIIYADIADHLAEFATLKAMGYGNRYFVGLVICESLYMSLLGYVPGALVSYGMYRWLTHGTGLLMIFNAPVAATVLVATIAMCVVSGCFALRKLLSTDPASLF